MVHVFLAIHVKAIAVLCLEFLRCQAGTHYCPIGQTLNIDTSVRSYQDERLLPRLEHPSDADSQEVTQCSWTIRANDLSTPRQLILQGMPRPLFAESHSGTAESTAAFHQPEGSFRYQMHLPADFKGSCQTIWPPQEFISSGLFRVMPISDSRMYMSVTADLKPGEPQTWSRVDLRAVMPQLGFCSRDMLSFQGRCYSVSPAPENVTSTISNIKGDAQMASFSSTEQINEFVAANNARLKVHPYKRPLNLSTAVRLGMFYNRTGDRILRVDKSENYDCQLVEVDGFQRVKSSTIKEHCISLRTENFDKPLIDLLSCTEPMLSLLSFPENPGLQPDSKCPEDCGERLLEYMAKLTATSSVSETTTWTSTEVIILTLVVVFISITSVILLSIALARSSACRKRCNEPTAEASIVDV